MSIIAENFSLYMFSSARNDQLTIEFKLNGIKSGFLQVFSQHLVHAISLGWLNLIKIVSMLTNYK